MNRLVPAAWSLSGLSRAYSREKTGTEETALVLQ